MNAAPTKKFLVAIQRSIPHNTAEKKAKNSNIIKPPLFDVLWVPIVVSKSMGNHYHQPKEGNALKRVV